MECGLPPVSIGDVAVIAEWADDRSTRIAGTIRLSIGAPGSSASE